MSGRLAGKVAFVTGGGRGLGKAIALGFAREGAAVAVAARTTEELQATVEELEEIGAKAVAVHLDVTSSKDVAGSRARIESTLGPVDVLVNNAGIHDPKPFLDYDPGDWKRTFDVNVHGTVRVTREHLPGMLNRGRGRILNMASTAGKYGSLYQSAYNASKHAVVGLTRCLALEVASTPIRVNALCPGFAETDLIANAVPKFGEIFGTDAEQAEAALRARIPIGRFVTPEEVAHLAVYLASDESDAMTGQALTISGGLILV